MRDLNDVLAKIKVCDKNWDGHVSNASIYPKIKITSPEQFVPLHLALEYFPKDEVISQYFHYLETKHTKPKATQEKIVQAFTNMWVREVSKVKLTEYRESLWSSNNTQNSKVALGTNLFRIECGGTWLAKLGLFASTYYDTIYTLESKQFPSTETSILKFNQIYYLVVVKAKVLPLVATSLLLQQPLNLDVSDIKVFFNNSLLEVETTIKIKESFPTLKKQGIEIINSTTEEMMKYLVGEQEEKTNEQLLEGARKILEEEMVFA